jgi:hypothetical protein
VDPFSPLLFIIVMAAAGKMISVAVSGGLLSRFSVGTVNDGGIDRDDTLIFCGVDPYHLRLLRCLFLCFKVVSNLKINLAKSELVDNVDIVEGLARILGGRDSSLPMKYLGLPLGASFKAKSFWDGIIEKIERRLAS